jgi:hypothetical protein
MILPMFKARTALSLLPLGVTPLFGDGNDPRYAERFNIPRKIRLGWQLGFL